MIDEKILIGAIPSNSLRIIILRQLQLPLFLFHTATGCISDGTIWVLFYQIIDAIISFRKMQVFLIEQSQTQLRLKITRHKNQKILVVEPGKVVSVQLLINKGTIKQSCYVGTI